MSFILSKAPKAVKAWPVSIPVASDGGSIKIAKITVDMNLLSKADFDARVADAKTASAAALNAGSSLDVDAIVLQAIVTGWSGIFDDAGNDVPFSIDALAQLATNQSALSAVYDAYFTAVAGKAAEKN